ncbi:glycerophosphodiester phosphodiesterase [Salimicrobium halophilum]|uniref:Glycerophosphoryl diester phosphodiesterase n=1 Tax=Salimicrobium halophilum TaxID=86666 RepID=A0A1G8PWF9_9BACI|nr:glycerophosphodiester phosphodiesterase [Salimicrobium halophilum]SDI96844.1 glycerophosphoryl diester phosphodiesterase [Salimicrobium halophilum]
MRTHILAHRGASRYAPENTMPAFRLAEEMGAEGVETDVQLTKDGVPVLIHDENVRRTTDGKGFVQDYTFEELRMLDTGSWFSSEFRGVQIPSLEELLQWIRDYPLLLHLELKTDVISYKHIEEKVYALLRHYQVLDRTCVSSFNEETLSVVKDLNPSMRTAFLTPTKMRKLIPYLSSIPVDDLHIKHTLLSKKLIHHCNKNRVPVRVYTVNRPALLRKCFHLQCAGIFTDVPDIAISIRKAKERST